MRSTRAQDYATGWFAHRQYVGIVKADVHTSHMFLCFRAQVVPGGHWLPAQLAPPLHRPTAAKDHVLWPTHVRCTHAHERAHGKMQAALTWHPDYSHLE